MTYPRTQRWVTLWNSLDCRALACICGARLNNLRDWGSLTIISLQYTGFPRLPFMNGLRHPWGGYTMFFISGHLFSEKSTYVSTEFKWLQPDLLEDSSVGYYFYFGVLDFVSLEAICNVKSTNIPNAWVSSQWLGDIGMVSSFPRIVYSWLLQVMIKHTYIKPEKRQQWSITNTKKEVLRQPIVYNLQTVYFCLSQLVLSSTSIESLMLYLSVGVLWASPSSGSMHILYAGWR